MGTDGSYDELMGKRSRRGKGEENQAPAAGPFNNPFGALLGIREQLPERPSSPSGPTEAEPTEAAPPGLERCGKVVVQREKKGRAGKTVTRVQGLSSELIERLEPAMKSALGCGATVEGEDLLLLGDLVERAARWLEREGARQVVISGAAGRGSKPARGRTSPAATPCRADIQPGQTVDIVLKQDQATGALTRGVVDRILTRSATHPHGIKVRLSDGSVGRVKQILG